MMANTTSSSLPEIRKIVVLNAPIEKVWEAVTTAKGIATWWMPSTFEPVLGFEFVLHAGPHGDSPCKVTELNPPYKIGFDWDKDWHLTFELREVDGGKTEFTLVHSGWDGNKTIATGQSHAVIRGIMDGGWEKIVTEKLPSYVED